MRTRRPAEDRKREIVEAARELVAGRGLAAVKSRELADAAGISEGLLFKYFPTKEALEEAIQSSCCSKAHLPSDPPSTRALALYFRTTLRATIASRPKADADVGRLLLRSLAGDGCFAREFFSKTFAPRAEWISKCLAAAEREGELENWDDAPRLRAWFPLLLHAFVLSTMLPARGAVEYGAPPARLEEALLATMLRSLGLKAGAVRREMRRRK